MRGFETAGVPSSYISAIEKGGLLPSAEKLEAISSVFVRVASEQEAADPQRDARILFDERDRTLFERLGVDPEMAEAFVRLKNLEPEQRAELAPPLRDIAVVLQDLDKEESAEHVHALREYVEQQLRDASPENGGRGRRDADREISGAR